MIGARAEGLGGGVVESGSFFVLIRGFLFTSLGAMVVIGGVV